MQVSDCYIHVRYRRLERHEFEELSGRLVSVAASLAAEVKRGQDLDYTFEEGTLWQRIFLIGGLMLGTVSNYHELRESILDIVHDAQKFSDLAINEFYKLTNTTPSDTIHKRTMPRDVNRLRRILASIDRILEGRFLDLRYDLFEVK